MAASFSDPDDRTALVVTTPMPASAAVRIVVPLTDVEEPSEASQSDVALEELATGNRPGAYETPDFDFSQTRRGGLPAEWFNGKKWTLTKDLLGKYPRRKQAYLKHKAARDFGKVLNTAFDGEGNLVIQAVKPKASEKNPLRAKMTPGSRRPAPKRGKKVSKKSAKKAGKKKAARGRK